MLKMKTIGATEADILHREIDAALKAIAEKHGLMHIRTGRLTYDVDGMFFRVPVEGKVNPVGENGLLTAAAKNSGTGHVLESLGCPLDAKAYIDGKFYKVTGYSPKRRKFPIDLRNTSDGIGARGTVSMVKAGITAYKLRFADRVNQG